jgi:hypothetical protein
MRQLPVSGCLLADIEVLDKSPIRPMPAGTGSAENEGTTAAVEVGVMTNLLLWQMPDGQDHSILILSFYKKSLTPERDELEGDFFGDYITNGGGC